MNNYKGLTKEDAIKRLEQLKAFTGPNEAFKCHTRRQQIEIRALEKFIKLEKS